MVVCNDGYVVSWQDKDGQIWYQEGPIKNLPKDVLDELLKRSPTPLEKLILEGGA
jgi:hypothetical protein